MVVSCLDHSIDMRQVLLILVVLASSACGTSHQWQKPGIAQVVVDTDLRQCRHAAMQESVRLYADWQTFPFDAQLFWNGKDLPTHRLVRDIVERSQLQAEQMLAVACMRNKGYVIAT
jgi:glutaredoxin-related protein